MMKTLIGLTLAASALLGPALAFAQTSNAPLTRAAVYADLVRLEHAGYDPTSSSDSTYPANIQAAEAKVAAEDATQTASSNATPVTDNAPATDTAAVGAAMSGSSASGKHESPMNKMENEPCVGPVSFCTPFFGS
ncbi:DUF4148 domain-containing protein [Paraburkholderia sp. DHOC27]|uniref:DUF4148 domain-containing protein n=1 Tax=Paraburkholderia sp. DHOC27 TaxID=2303330 RepID=UPI000E3CB6A6|nr:DUF4148 domain-containing protein [Paraburkholderia sp. DHOC27]RFU45219.1 DUF4148 domain-containing protein [Paraburkholderia sp. DHOC27]